MDLLKLNSNNSAENDTINIASSDQLNDILYQVQYHIEKLSRD